MKFCGPHWERLKRALADRGLAPFIATTSADLGRRLQADLEGGAAPAVTFEPLMGAHNAILENTLRVAGLEPMAPKADGGEWCPVCYLMTCQCGDPECPKRFEGWIERAADDMLAEARRLNLVSVN